MAQANAPEPADAARRRASVSTMRRLAVVAVAMFGFGFLLVPLYEKICEVTGIRDIARPDDATNTQVDASRSIRIELDATLHQLAWTFKPAESVVNVHPGELRQVVYEVVNTTDRPVVGQAIPSYAPRQAGEYFKKLDCFCFTAQALAPGERREMPVVFVIDPKLPRDVVTITLSYTFFEIEGGQKVATSAAAAPGDKP